MARPYKIKRNHRIYRSKKVSVGHFFKWFLVFVLGAGLVFFGFSIAGPALDFLMGKSSVIEPSSSSSQISVSQPSVSSSPSSSSQQATAGAIKGSVISVDTLGNSAKLDSFIANAKTQGINTVMVTLKDSTGAVLYASKLPKVTQYGALSPTAVDLAAPLQKLKDNGISVIAEIYAFKDAKASYGDRAMAVKYQGTEMLWLDNFKEKGGVPWLNPYNAEARDYVSSIAAEVAGLGVDAIAVKGLQFPTNASGDSTYPGAGSTSKDQALADSLAGIKAAISSSGKKLIVELPAAAAVGNMSAQYGTSPLSLGADYVGVDLDISLMGKSFKIGDTVIETPSSAPFQATDAVIKKVSSGLSGKKLIVFISGVGDIFTEQIRAVTSNQVADYILES